MPASYLYPDIKTVLTIHEQILSISWEGGSRGMIDQWSIEKVLELVQNDVYYKALYEKISYLLYWLVMNHGFVDGNKRTALGTTALFIWENTQDIILTDKFLKKFENVVVDIASWNLSKNELQKLVKFFLFSYLEENTSL